MIKIVERDHKVLREKAQEVPISDIKSAKIQNIIRDMKIALEGEEDGVAIAAPQIGESLRIFVVSGRAISMFKNVEERSPDVVFINPVILKISKSTEWMEEGCLSVRYLYGKVKRAEKVTISACNENGEKFEVGSAGILAQIFQHETDHLDGILFTDKAKDIQDIPPESLKASHTHE